MYVMLINQTRLPPNAVITMAAAVITTNVTTANARTIVYCRHYRCRLDHDCYTTLVAVKL